MKRSTFLWIIAVSATLMAFYQAFWIAPEITVTDPHSDALIYLELSQTLDFFEQTHITFRWVIPLLAYLLHFIFEPLPTISPYILSYALLNVGLFVIGCSSFWKLVNPRSSKHYLPALSPLLLLMGVPFFWRSAFLPMVDTAAFTCIALMLLAFRNRNPILLLVTTILAVFTKEISLLILLAFPLIDWANKRQWVIGYIIPLFSILIYISTVWISLDSVQHYYLMHPSDWFQDWSQTVTHIEWQDLRYPLSAFGLLLPALLFIYLSDFNNRAYSAAALLLFGFFLLFWLFTPTNSPRLMFMMLPLSYLFFRNE